MAARHLCSHSCHIRRASRGRPIASSRRYDIVAAMSIRPARDDDFPAIAAITNHYIATTAIHFAYEPVTVDEGAAHWRDGHFPWFVVDEGRVIGYAKAGTWRDRAAYRWTTEIGL